MYSSSRGCHTATGTHMPHGITQCYLPPGRGDIPALAPAEAGTRLSDPEGCKAELTCVQDTGPASDGHSRRNIAASLTVRPDVLRLNATVRKSTSQTTALHNTKTGACIHDHSGVTKKNSPVKNSNFHSNCFTR